MELLFSLFASLPLAQICFKAVGRQPLAFHPCHRSLSLAMVTVWVRSSPALTLAAEFKLLKFKSTDRTRERIDSLLIQSELRVV